MALLTVLEHIRTGSVQANRTKGSCEFRAQVMLRVDHVRKTSAEPDYCAPHLTFRRKLISVSQNNAVHCVAFLEVYVPVRFVHG